MYVLKYVLKYIVYLSTNRYRKQLFDSKVRYNYILMDERGIGIAANTRGSRCDRQVDKKTVK